MPTTWQAIVDMLSPADLTVLAQDVPPNDDGELLWDIYMPRQNVASVNLDDITTIDYRPVADRREWNTRGRRIPPPSPARRKVSIVPIEANVKLDELELQYLGESPTGNEALVRELIGVDIPSRVEQLAGANYRRVEMDWATAWALGTITQRNPENAAQTYAASFGFSVNRYTTAGTAWNAVANAYETFLAWLTSASDMIGAVEGAMMRQATFNEILADAPDLPGNVSMQKAALPERVQQDTGGPFTFYINERSVDLFDDGGIAYTRTKVWPAQRVAAIPAGRVVGRTAFAPVVRAMEIASQVGESAGVDVRGNTVYYAANNGGRELDIECQINALPIPDETKMFVINCGV